MCVALVWRNVRCCIALLGCLAAQMNTLGQIGLLLSAMMWKWTGIPSEGVIDAASWVVAATTVGSSVSYLTSAGVKFR